MSRAFGFHIGDIIKIQLRNGRFGYGQVVFLDVRSDRSGLGVMIRVFNYTSKGAVPLTDLPLKGEMFPPIYVLGIKPALRHDGWRIIGNLPVGKFVYPKFRQTFNAKPGLNNDWQIWDGNRWKFVGRLSPKQRSLELYCAWGSRAIEQRIKTGVNPAENLM